MKDILAQVKQDSMLMGLIKSEDKNDALKEFAKEIQCCESQLLTANAKDLESNRGKISDSMFQRLKLDKTKLRSVVNGLNDIINIPDPVGRVQIRRELDKNLVLERVSVPLGVVAVVFESRPDVIPQILGLALKSGNAVVLKGGSEAVNTNQAFMSIIKRIGQKYTFFPENWAVLLDSREEFRELLKYDKFIDLVIPRGSNQLVRDIKSSTKIPVLGHADGVCHVYVHENADIEMAVKIASDSKAQYPSACNAAETLLVDRNIAAKFLVPFNNEAKAHQIELIGCEETKKILPDIVLATEEDWVTEYSDYRFSVRVVADFKQAIEHINRYGSHHTDSIVTQNEFVAEMFLNGVDSASVFHNASTRFADGYRFGFGAEVGVSTEKVHARGPVGVEGLMTYKYKLRGHGDIVADYSGVNPTKQYRHKDLKI